MRFSRTIGVEQPLAGRGAFQTTEASVHCVGKPPTCVLPLFFGPRHCGQSASGAPADEALAGGCAATASKAAIRRAGQLGKSKMKGKGKGERGRRMGVGGCFVKYRLENLLQPYSGLGKSLIRAIPRILTVVDSGRSGKNRP